MPNIKRIPADAPPPPDPKSESQLRNAVVQQQKVVDKLTAERYALRMKRDWKAWEKTTEPLQAELDKFKELRKAHARAVAGEAAGDTTVKVGTAKESNK